MNNPELSRRTMLQGLAVSLGIAGTSWPLLVRAAHDAHAAAHTPALATYILFNAADAADVEALTAQIMPSDDTPGARDAGVSFFIDRVLGSLLAHWRPGFEAGLDGFQSACRAAHPKAASFAALTPALQIEFLHTIETTPFFEQARLLTLCGMLSSPKYGGNRDGLGWKMLGFEDQHVFEPPFGFYDRDYPGFKPDSGKSS